MTDTHRQPDGETTDTPRWVKGSAIVALVVIVTFIVLLVTGRGGDHGPGRHTPPAGIEHRQQQP